MSDRIPTPKNTKSPIETKTKKSPSVKKVTLYPPAKREMSPEPLFDTDRYRLSEPLFPELDSIEVKESEEA